MNKSINYERYKEFTDELFKIFNNYLLKNKDKKGTAQVNLVIITKLPESFNRLEIELIVKNFLKEKGWEANNVKLLAWDKFWMRTEISFNVLL